MMRLNRKVEYALLALKYMSQKTPGQLTTAKEIAEKLGCPYDATSRVLQIMAANGILKSEHGSQGGYMIVRDLSKVNFLLLNEIILGPVEVAKCLQKEGDSECELLSSCNIMAPVKNLNAKLNVFFKEIPLAQILGLHEVSGGVGPSAEVR
jgi:Rrf2 family protein